MIQGEATAATSIPPIIACRHALLFWEHGQLRAVVARPLLTFFFLGFSRIPASGGGGGEHPSPSLYHLTAACPRDLVPKSSRSSAESTSVPILFRPQPQPGKALRLHIRSPMLAGWPFWNRNSSKFDVPRPRASCPPCVEQHIRLMLWSAGQPP